jgi:hypothetical protein
VLESKICVLAKVVDTGVLQPPLPEPRVRLHLVCRCCQKGRYLGFCWCAIVMLKPGSSPVPKVVAVAPGSLILLLLVDDSFVVDDYDFRNLMSPLIAFPS